MVLVAVTTSVVMMALDVNDFTFSHLGRSEGMHSQRIYDICQSNDGAIWWATKNGVERYNGVTISHYPLGKQGIYSTDGGRYIKLRINETPDGAMQLYAFDDKGSIYIYNEATDQFIEEMNIRQLIAGDVTLNDILFTQQGIWTATHDGIYLINHQKANVVTKGVRCNYIIKTGKKLLFCTREGVYETAAKATSTAKIRKIASQDIESGYYDPIYNKVWLGGFSCGLFVLENNGTITQVSAKEDGWQQPIRSICPYNSKMMLVGIDGKGIHWVSRKPDAQGRYQTGILFDANEGPQGVLHGNGIYSVMIDSWDNIIIGSYSGGIDIARPVGSTEATFRHIQNNQQSILNDHVNTVIQCSPSLLAMGTDNGVSMLNTQTRHWTHCCQKTVVLSLCKTPEGKLLASTYGKGVYEITAEGARQLYSIANGILQDDHVFKLLYDHRGTLWMGCLEGALVEKSSTGIRYHQVHNVNDMMELPDGRIAVGTAYGLWTVNPATGKVDELKYQTAEGDDTNRFVLTLLMNGRNELWIGTDGGGVYIYNLQSKQCSQLTTANGLPSNSVRSLSQDRFGRIMMATEHGLAFVKPSQPNHVVDVNYCYGLDCEYTNGAAVNLTNGHLLFGTTSGAVIINPENIQEINYISRLRLKSVTCGDNDDDHFKEETYQMLKDGELVLPYNKRTFNLRFESINLRNQYDIVYQYQVANGEWSQPSEQQQIRFTNLEPGEHQLLLRSISRTCGATLDEIQLTIHIKEPWWNSWWMKFVYFCLILVAFYGAWRVYKLHTKYMRLVVNNPKLNANYQAAIQNQSETSAEEQTDEGSEFISKVTKLVIDNLSDTEFNIDRLCQEMAMSRTLFYVKLKTYTGKSPQDFIRIIRLERSAVLLRNHRSVAEAAALTGFDNPKYFSTVFKKYFGVSPSKYQ